MDVKPVLGAEGFPQNNRPQEEQPVKFETETPLSAALSAFASGTPLRLHMPGHKGQPLAGIPYPTALDFTELPPTGNLYEPGGPIDEAEALWARFWGADACLFLTGGATQGLHTALRCALSGGGSVLCDRMSHRSIHTGLALLGAEVHWLSRKSLAGCDTAAPLTPEEVEAGLREHPDARTVVLTSPTYYGVLSDVAGIAAVCHRHRAALVVDGAHGAHLFLLGENPYRAADYAVVSAHKTLRAPGQSALLFARGVSADTLRRSSLLFATSSPSYAMLAALDCLRPWCAGEGGRRYRETAQAVAALRKDYPALTDADAPLDPCRFTLHVPDGFALEEALHARGIYPEMADRAHVVCIFTEADTEATFTRFRAALDALGLRGAARPKEAMPPLPELPARRCSLREAFLARADETETVPWAEAAGRVSAELLAPYPPGVPVVAPGEEISKKVLAYLHAIGYNKSWIQVLRKPSGE